jgi:hypothetical protein
MAKLGRMDTISPRSKTPFIAIFPSLLLALLAYNIAAWLGHDFKAASQSTVFTVHLISGALWGLGWNELFVIGALLLVFFEIIKSTKTTHHSTAEHVFSMFVFIAFLVEFLIVPYAGTNTFFLLGVFALIDVLCGYAISIAVARKDLNIT